MSDSTSDPTTRATGPAAHGTVLTYIDEPPISTALADATLELIRALPLDGPSLRIKVLFAANDRSRKEHS